MAFDYKKEQKEFYLPKETPTLITIPSMNYLLVRGSGDPNEEGGEYSEAIHLLYAVSYTLKMSKKGSYHIAGYFDYVVPPLEGFWWQENITGVDYQQKEKFSWMSLIRLPDFIREQDVIWAKETVWKKKKIDCSKVEFFAYEEGLCVQCMHIGSYDKEPKTVQKMDAFLDREGYENDLSGQRYHHEIYLSDPRKGDISKRKTVIRHPIKKK